MGDRGKPRVVVSACLMGEAVRYDGTDRRCDTAIKILGPEVEWIPVCPEVGLGLGVPRETLRLEGKPDAPRMLTTVTRIDHTDGMLAWVRWSMDSLARMGVHGFLLKGGSPSCGPDGVPVHCAEGIPEAGGMASVRKVSAGENGDPALKSDHPEAVVEASRERRGSGLYAGQARLRFPEAPIADEAAISDPDQARLFLERVRACRDRAP